MGGDDCLRCAAPRGNRSRWRAAEVRRRRHAATGGWRAPAPAAHSPRGTGCAAARGMAAHVSCGRQAARRAVRSRGPCGSLDRGGCVSAPRTAAPRRTIGVRRTALARRTPRLRYARGACPAAPPARHPAPADHGRHDAAGRRDRWLRGGWGVGRLRCGRATARAHSRDGAPVRACVRACARVHV
jgi:hypothetical protein